MRGNPPNPARPVAGSAARLLRSPGLHDREAGCFRMEFAVVLALICTPLRARPGLAETNPSLRK